MSLRPVLSPRRFMFALCVIVAALGAAHSLGQTSPPPTAAGTSGSRVAVIDLVRIFNETAQIMDLNDVIKQKNEDYSKEANQRRKVIEDKQTELAAFKPGSNDYETRRKNLIRLNIEANVWLKVSEQEVEQMRFDWTKVVYEKALSAAADIAKDRSLDMVVQKTEWRPQDIEQNLQSLRRAIQDRTVVYCNSGNDITDVVVQQMNRDYKAAGGKTSLGLSSKP